jgi:hypothetical protein
MLGDDCARAEGDFECVAGLTCSSDNGKCRALPQAGEACVHGACAPGVTCVPDVIGNGPGVCARGLDLGSPCKYAQGLPSGCPLLDTVCSQQGQCVNQAVFAGDACGPGKLPCGLGTRCGADGLCHLPLTVGQPCTPPSMGQWDSCAYGTACDPTSKVCVGKCG